MWKSGTAKLVQMLCLLACMAVCAAGTIGCKKEAAPVPAEVPEELFPGHIPDTIMVAAYNVENLFDMIDDGGEYPEYKPRKNNWTLATYQTKIANISLAIATLSADVIALCEIENENVVNALRAALEQRQCPYPYYALGDRPYRTNTMPVILSRYPLIDVQGFGALGAEGAPATRNILEARVYLRSDTLTVFACHWPSKAHPESRRLAMAKLLRDRIERLPSSVEYVVAGDLNGNHDECASFHSMGFNDTRGVTGINHLLATVRGASGVLTDFYTKADCAAADTGIMHFNPWLDVPEHRRMSLVYRGQQQTPDHILLPRTLFNAAGLSYADGSFSPFTWNGRLLDNGVPYRWKMHFEGKRRIHAGAGYSDHLPVSLKLYKGAYTAASPGKETRPIATDPGVTDFSTGTEGWVSCGKIKVSQDKIGNEYCCKIAGVIKQNGCAARVMMPVSQKKNRHIAFKALGRGTLSIRVKVSSDKQWVYFNGATFRPAKAGKYTPFVFKKWTPVELPFSVPAGATDIEIELRAKKDVPVEFWIDKVRGQ